MYQVRLIVLLRSIYSMLWQVLNQCERDHVDFSDRRQTFFFFFAYSGEGGGSVSVSFLTLLVGENWFELQSGFRETPLRGTKCRQVRSHVAVRHRLEVGVRLVVPVLLQTRGCLFRGADLSALRMLLSIVHATIVRCKRGVVCCQSALPSCRATTRRGEKTRSSYCKRRQRTLHGVRDEATHGGAVPPRSHNRHPR